MFTPLFLLFDRSWQTMTEEIEAHFLRIDSVMQQFYNYADTMAMGLEGATALVKSIEPDLLAVIDAQRELEQDYRTGNETFGYGYTDKTKILANLIYISDRWRAAVRMTWLLGLVNHSYR